MAKVPRRNAATNMASQARYIHIQTRKGVTTAAGVEAIVESPEGAFKVGTLDEWWFFNQSNPNNYRAQKDNRHIHELKDPRLLRRLQSTGLFPQLNMLVHLPPNVSHEKIKTIPARQEHVGRASYFPTWAFCTKCARLKPLSAWWEGWQQTLRYKANIHQTDRVARLFTYDASHTGRPNCHHCYEDNFERGKKWHKLEQVRFVLASHNSDLMDIPWWRWIKSYRSDGAGGDEGEVVGGKIALGQECCGSPRLKYNRSNKLSDLAGINIECESCHDRRTLAGLFNMRHRHGSALYKPLIRSSNSIYYPITYQSLYIPEAASLAPNLQTTIRTMQQIGRTVKEIADSLGLEEQQVQEVLGLQRFLSEAAYREREYQYILQSAAGADDVDLVAEDVTLTDTLRTLGLARLIKVTRLKMTSVQTGFTRLGPMDNDVFGGSGGVRENFRFDDSTVTLRAKFTVANPLNTEYLAGVECFGEGLFIQWADERIAAFVNDYMVNDETGPRLLRLYQRYRNSEMANQDKITDEQHLLKHVLIHTLSHLLIKELEFLCGYPSSSISERLYCNRDGMNGLLLYTIAGAEGSFGGLIEQGNPEAFANLFSSALSRATDCNSDPICSHNEAQGVGGLNNAACFSCALISETSCEEFNSFLDRNLVIGDGGFLASHLVLQLS